SFIASNKKDFILIEGTHHHQCDPASGLCFLPQFNSDPSTGALCPIKILEGATVSTLNSVCAFSCTGNKLQTSITQLSMQSFIITGGPPGMEIRCVNGTSSTSTPLHPTPDGVGAIYITLPCKCAVFIPG